MLGAEPYKSFPVSPYAHSNDSILTSTLFATVMLLNTAANWFLTSGPLQPRYCAVPSPFDNTRGGILTVHAMNDWGPEGLGRDVIPKLLQPHCGHSRKVKRQGKFRVFSGSFWALSGNFEYVFPPLRYPLWTLPSTTPREGWRWTDAKVAPFPSSTDEMPFTSQWSVPFPMLSRASVPRAMQIINCVAVFLPHRDVPNVVRGTITSQKFKLRGWFRNVLENCDPGTVSRDFPGTLEGRFLATTNTSQIHSGLKTHCLTSRLRAGTRRSEGFKTPQLDPQIR